MYIHINAPDLFTNGFRVDLFPGSIHQWFLELSDRVSAQQPRSWGQERIGVLHSHKNTFLQEMSASSRLASTSLPVLFHVTEVSTTQETFLLKVDTKSLEDTDGISPLDVRVQLAKCVQPVQDESDGLAWGTRGWTSNLF